MDRDPLTGGGGDMHPEKGDVDGLTHRFRYQPYEFLSLIHI